MDHPFIVGGEPDKCVKCRRKEIDHSDLASCEACLYVGPCELYMKTILLCPQCIQKEHDHQSPEKQEARERAYRESTVNLAKEIDYSIKSRADFFNAETTDIGTLRDAIAADNGVENKRVALFEVVLPRYKNYKQRLIDIEEEKSELAMRIRASFEYMVTLSNQFTEEERKKYQLQDFNYKPNQTVTKPKPAPKAKKFDKAELTKLSEEHDIPMVALQTLCVRFNCSVMEAVSRYKQAMGIA